MTNIDKRSNGVWRARYYDEAGKQHARHFPRKVDAQSWLDTITASVVRGDYVDPKTARTTVEQWCATWLDGYKTRRPGTVKMAGVHIKLINKEFGPLPLSAVRPSMVKAWTAKMKGQELRDVLRLRGLSAVRSDHGRRGSGWHHPEVAMQPEDVARSGLAAALRGHHGTGVGIA